MKPEVDYSASILESLSEGIVAFDGNRRSVMANSYMVLLMGWQGRPVVGETPESLFSERPDLMKLLEEGVRGRVLSTPTDLIQHGPEGRIQHLRVTTSSLSAEANPGVVMVVRDVSELKRMEWEIFQVEKMSALGRLAASVAHEVRNPLGAIDIQLQLLEEDLSDVFPEFRERLYRRLNIAQTEMKRLDRIVRNFLRFSRTPKLHLQRLSINDVVRHVFELVSPEAREQGIRLGLDLLPGLPSVDGDENQLGQAILNMTVNAFQSIERDGEVHAKTWVDPQLGQVCMALSDTGCGIPEAEIDRIFEFYYTTKDEGTGLGLSIAQRIIYQHGGHIEIESKEEVGTMFRIYLPISTDRSERDEDDRDTHPHSRR